MSGEPGTPPADAVIARLAAQQHGVVARRQLRRAGVADDTIDHRLRTRRLHPVHRGVFAVGRPDLSADGRAMAAVLACGDGAVLSHGSAAMLWGIRRGAQARWDVLLPSMSGGLRGPAAVHPRRTRRLDPSDVTTIRGLPVTTLPRTLIDLATVLTPQRLAAAVHEAEVQRVLDVRSVEAAIARHPGRRGIAALRAALAPQAPPPSGEAFVTAFAGLCARHGLPMPTIDTHVDDGRRLHQVDALFAAYGLIVELDGEQVHGTRRRFHTDRRRDAALAAAGYQTIRLTWDRVTREDVEVAAQLRRVLARRRPTAGPRPR
jgi:hypothetical protein